MILQYEKQTIKLINKECSIKDEEKSATEYKSDKRVLDENSKFSNKKKIKIQMQMNF